jgi:hypothetical protein
MLYDVGMWGLEGGLKENDEIQCKFCKKIIRVWRFAADDLAELEFER